MRYKAVVGPVVKEKKERAKLDGGGGNGMEWNGMTCLDSRRLCLPVEQPGFPNYSRVQGSMSHQTPGPEVQKWHSAELHIPQLDGVQVQL
jgi:hypothetical protein